MSFESIVALLVILFFFIGGWYGLSYIMSPRLTDPDGMAKVTGNCGDTMEIGFRLQSGKVAQTHFWTDGCSMSRSCIESAARLAYGKTPDQLKTLNMSHIVDDLGHVPDSHLHCAQLAEISLHQALENYHASSESTAKR